MGDLFGSLTSAARALDAQRYGLDVAGQNIANVNTPGYARRVVELSAVAPDGPGSAGRGVDVTGIRGLRDLLLEDRLHREVPSQSREAAIASALSVVETSLGKAGHSIDASLDNFFNAFDNLAQDPTSANARREVALQGDDLGRAFRDMASRLVDGRNAADRHIRSTVEEINGLTAQIAELNEAIAGATPESTLHSRDEQSQLVRQLSELVDIGVLQREDGGVDISVASGRPLVVGVTPYAIDVTSVAPSGFAALSVNGTTITSDIEAGSLGGYLHVRDVAIPDYQARLDVIAFEVADQVNTLHNAGFDQTGAAGGGFFEFTTPPAGTAGAAAALIIRSAIAADPRLIAAGDAAQVGNNEQARAIAGLRDNRVLDSNTATLSDAWGQLVYRVGRDTKTAADTRDTRAEIVRQVDALRDEVSGVSLDEEAMHLLKFQRAYEANAKFFTVIDDTLSLLLGLVR